MLAYPGLACPGLHQVDVVMLASQQRSPGTVSGGPASRRPFLQLPEKYMHLQSECDIDPDY